MPMHSFMKYLQRTAALVILIPASFGAMTAQQAKIAWQVLLGGSGMDAAYSVLTTPRGEFFFTGFSGSKDGDFTDHHGAAGTNDGICGLIDSSGHLLWKKSIGGSGS